MKTKKLFVAAIVMVMAVLQLNASEITVSGNVAGNLKKAIETQGADPMSVTSLTLSGGEVNGTDIRLIREMGGSDFNRVTNPAALLNVLDMKGCRIVKGGLSYVCSNNGTEYYTSDDIIGVSMFLNCVTIRELKIPQSVTALEDGYNFSGMVKLKSIEMNDNLSEIPENAFSYTGLEEIKLPAGLKSIGSSAFLNGGLKSIAIPESVESIAGSAFMGCEQLKTVTWPSKLKEFAKEVFAGCVNLETISNFPTEVNFVGVAAFGDCRSLEGVSVNLGKDAQINKDSFYCATIDNFTVDAENTEYSALDGVLYDKNKTVLIKSHNREVGSLTIPSTVTVIADDAFYQAKVKSVITPVSLKEIGQEAFSGSILENIKLCEGIEDIKDGAFKMSTMLLKIEIPSSVKSLGKGVFLNCFNLNTVILNEGLESIGGSAFWFTKVESIHVPSTVNKIWGGAFGGMGALATLTVASGNKDYKSVDNDIYTIDGSQLIKVAAHNGKEKYETLPECTSVETAAFEGNKSIKELVISNPDTELMENCLVDIFGLEKIVFPANAAQIGEEMCNGVSALKECVLPLKLQIIGAAAFSGCALKSVTLPAGVTNISKYAFSECTKLEYVQSFAAEHPEAGNSEAESAFRNTDLSKVKLYVPMGSKPDYVAAYPWSQFGEIIETAAPVGVEKISRDEKAVILAANGGIAITAPDPVRLDVYSTGGILLKSLTVSGDTFIPLDRGVYVVHTESTAKKVVVK